MKNSTDEGFDQHYHAQVAVDHASLLVLGCRVSDQANDKQQALPTLDAIPSAVGKPASASLDNGYFSEGNIEDIEAREVEPYIATGRQRHHRSWQAYFAGSLEEPPEEATAKEKMAYKLKTELGKAIYRLRKCTAQGRCWALSRRCWGSDSFCSGVWPWSRGSGRWSAWVST